MTTRLEELLHFAAYAIERGPNRPDLDEVLSRSNYYRAKTNISKRYNTRTECETMDMMFSNLMQRIEHPKHYTEDQDSMLRESCFYLYAYDKYDAISSWAYILCEFLHHSHVQLNDGMVLCFIPYTGKYVHLVAEEDYLQLLARMTMKYINHCQYKDLPWKVEDLPLSYAAEVDEIVEYHLVEEYQQDDFVAQIVTVLVDVNVHEVVVQTVTTLVDVKEVIITSAASHECDQGDMRSHHQHLLPQVEKVTQPQPKSRKKKRNLRGRHVSDGVPGNADTHDATDICRILVGWKALSRFLGLDQLGRMIKLLSYDVLRRLNLN